MSIRRACPEDIHVIKRIAEEAYRPYVARLGKAPAPMVADFAAHIDRDLVFLSEKEGIVAGYAILSNNEQRALLDNIAVDPACQGGGVGRALIDEVERQVAALGYRSLDLYTNVVMTANIAWYRKLGFVETGLAREYGFHRVYMRKALASNIGGQGQATTARKKYS